MKRILFTVLSLVFLFCSISQSDENKILIALIDFADETPNKMALTPDKPTENNKVNLPKVMQIVREQTENCGLFELLPQETVEEAMKTQIGKDAAARRYDRFGAARLGKMLAADALLTGEIIQFEKSVIAKDFTINGLDFSKRTGDVVIRIRLINAYNGIELADISCSGDADENVLESISAAVSNRLSIGFQQATVMCIQNILEELESADIKIDKEYTPIQLSQNNAETINFTVVKIEGKYIYINAGRDKDVSIADLYFIVKENGALDPETIYSVSKVGRDSSQLVLVEPKDAEGIVKVGDKVQRKARGTAARF
ncbi:MAG: CsgG/HfaB family protein [Synergistaceae bacterium]|nr:CsgG/HfaB family protein [Synergistaceae bacterium]